jgi:trypsin
LKQRPPILFLGFLFLACACGKKPESGGIDFTGETKDPVQIIGGKEATRSVPGASSVVMITGEAEDGTSYICTGTIVSKQDVLTAAHCISPHPQSMNVIFELNAFAAGKDPVTLNILKAFVHPPTPHQKKLQNDLGWIRLQGPLPEGAKPARLDLEDSEPVQSQKSLLVLGFGRTTGLESADPSDLSGAGVLRSAWVQVQNLDVSKQTFSVLQKAGHGVCSGDSGGPIFRTSEAEPVLVGVASAVDRIKNDPSAADDICKNKSIFTNLKNYREWIRLSLASPS